MPPVQKGELPGHGILTECLGWKPTQFHSLTASTAPGCSKTHPTSKVEHPLFFLKNYLWDTVMDGGKKNKQQPAGLNPTFRLLIVFKSPWCPEHVLLR